MKNTSIILASIMLFMASCTANKKDDTSSETSIEVKSEDATKVDKLTLMMSVTPLPNYLNILFKNKTDLDLSAEQLKKLKESSDDRNPQAIKIASQIAGNKEKMYQQSLEKTSKEDLMAALENNLELSIKIAVLKIGCRDEVIETLTEEQWNNLAVIYKEKMPFDDKIEIMELVEHINPVPNYMQLISNPKLELNEAQDAQIAKWQKENNPKMAKLLRSVNALEKDIYDISLLKESKSNMLAKVDEINELKRQILTLKTDCRDNLINSVLSEDQWAILASK